MNGFNVAVAGHVVNALSPRSIQGGATSQAWSMKGAEHVSIVIAFGVDVSSPPVSPPTVPTAILVNQCSDANGSNPVALGFRYYYQTKAGAGNDILDGTQQSLASTPSQPPNYATAAGITTFPTFIAGLVIIIEIDAAELEAAADVVGTINEKPYLNVQITDAGNAINAAVLAILSGLRFQYNIGASQTV